MGTNVDHPSHYNTGKIEVIDYIDDQQLNFSLGNAVKYISRAGKKDKHKQIEDLEKAVWYINHEIERLKKDPSTWCIANDPERWCVDHDAERLNKDSKTP